MDHGAPKHPIEGIGGMTEHTGGSYVYLPKSLNLIFC